MSDFSNEVMQCHKVPLNIGGYAYSGTTYFGRDHLPLYFIEFTDGRNGHVRAASRAEAIATAVEKSHYWGIR